LYGTDCWGRADKTCGGVTPGHVGHERKQNTTKEQWISSTTTGEKGSVSFGGGRGVGPSTRVLCTVVTHKNVTWNLTTNSPSRKMLFKGVRETRVGKSKSKKVRERQSIEEVGADSRFHQEQAGGNNFD